MKGLKIKTPKKLLREKLIGDYHFFTYEVNRNVYTFGIVGGEEVFWLSIYRKAFKRRGECLYMMSLINENAKDVNNIDTNVLSIEELKDTQNIIKWINTVLR